jgi:glycosyltransferase involved in cell wall biosynthesis
MILPVEEVVNKNNIKILTDIDIPQSKTWGDRTKNIKDLFPHQNILIDGSESSKEILYYLWRFVTSMRQYDVIVTANIKLAQLVALYRFLFFIRKPKQIVLELMLDEEASGWIWKLKVKFQRLLFSSVDLVFVSSTREVETYSRRLRIPPEKFRFIPFHTNIINPRRLGENEGFILSAGKTGRDYAVLNEALRGTDMKAVIVSDDYHLKGIDISANITVRKNIPYSEYLTILEKSRLVVVPLTKHVMSTGQVVILEAMALGKPVIATETVGTLDYIENGITGILVPIGDKGALRKAIHDLIRSPSLEEDLARNGLEKVRRDHTFESYVGRILLAAEELVRETQPNLREVS